MPRPRERIYPFFLGMAGCPGECVYCDQKRTADPGAFPTPADVTVALDRDLNADGPWTVAFYGGTFTGLPVETIAAYLNAVWASCYASAIDGVRVSTRPDMVGDDVLAVLAEGRVKTIELGVQSFDDGVLRAANRGYTAGEAADACAAVKAAGFVLGVQLMVGLSRENRRVWRKSVEKTVEVGPDFVRLYPTLVIKNTRLAAVYAAGVYKPLGLDEAVRRCADAGETFLSAGVRIERVGLQEIPGLADEVIAGPYHPAFGDLVRTEIINRKLTKSLAGRTGEVTVWANGRTVPAVIGYGRRNVRYLRDAYGLELKVERDNRLGDYVIVIKRE